MARRSITNQQLADRIDHGLEDVRTDFLELKQDMRGEMKEIRKDMQKFRDFMVVQIDRQKHRKEDGSKDWQGLAKQFIVGLLAAMGVLVAVIQALSRG